MKGGRHRVPFWKRHSAAAEAPKAQGGETVSSSERQPLPVVSAERPSEGAPEQEREPLIFRCPHCETWNPPIKAFMGVIPATPSSGEVTYILWYCVAPVRPKHTDGQMALVASPQGGPSLPRLRPDHCGGFLGVNTVGYVPVGMDRGEIARIAEQMMGRGRRR